MIDAFYISLWAYLFCVPLSESGQVFGWLKQWLFKTVEQGRGDTGEMLFKILIGCAKCHAGQVALWWQVWEFSHGRGFSIPFILIAIAGASALTTWHKIVDNYLHK